MPLLRNLSTGLIAMLLCGSMPAQNADTTLPPSVSTLRYTVEGRGVQIYSCKQAASGYEWSYDAPEADLFDNATLEKVGTHGAGPTWTWKDGSSITGKVVASKPAPDSGNIPWLLLSATAPTHAGGLGYITFVRRSNTHGGVAPATGCDEAHAGAVARVQYTATYTFYSDSK